MNAQRSILRTISRAALRLALLSLLCLAFSATGCEVGDYGDSDGAATPDVADVHGGVDTPPDVRFDVPGRPDGGHADIPRPPDDPPDDPRADPRIATESLPAAIAGVAYGPFVLVADGGTPPYEWVLAEGVEPHEGFFDPERATLAGLPAVPGDYALTFAVTDAAGASARAAFTLTVAAPASFDSLTASTIDAGEHWLGDFTARADETVRIAGGTTLNVTGALRIAPGARVEVADCGELVINLLSPDAPAEILGDLSNACEDPDERGGDLVLRAVGGLRLGSDAEDAPQGHVATSGHLFIGDPWYAPRPEPEEAEYTVASEPEDVGPACAVRSDAIGAGHAGVMPLAVALDAIHVDPDGGETFVASVDWGDGAVDQRPDALLHTYGIPGTYEVLVTVADDEQDECEAALTLHVSGVDDPDLPPDLTAERAPTSLWATVTPFEAPALTQPVGVPFAVVSQRALPDSAAAWETDSGPIPCPDGAAECAADVAFETPGLHTVAIVGETPGGDVSAARFTVYVPLRGGKRAVSDPSAPARPFPALPPTIVPADAGHGPAFKRSTAVCDDCALCQDPTISSVPVAILGNTRLTAWGQGSAIVIGFESATVVINPTFAFQGAPGEDGGPGEDGRPGGGFAAASRMGRIVLCGGRFAGAPGGDGGDLDQPRCDRVTRAGHGGSWFGVLFAAPFGSLSYCGAISVAGADGGDGGRATNDATRIAKGACADACGAVAMGGRGGLGGGGIAYLAGNVCFDRNYSVTFDAAGAQRVGGRGGDADAMGNTPPACRRCKTYAGSGGQARAVAGDGGRSAWYFVTAPDRRPPDEVLRDHLFAAGTYVGGDGGDANAWAGSGGEAICSGCDEWALGGRGGRASARGGTGAYGLGNRGKGGDVAAYAGFGGDATATPNPAKPQAKCPATAGCDLQAVAGDGGKVSATPGRGRPMGTRLARESGPGGDATATGGDGGDGLGCPGCPGGPGGKAFARGGGDPQGRPFRRNGAAAVLGGKGGDGSNCCDPPAPGGNGGRGGNAKAEVYRGGVLSGKAGDGGDAGEGEPPGDPGRGGLGEGVERGSAGNKSRSGAGGGVLDGDDGAPNEGCPIDGYDCLVDADCDDGDPCTVDVCDPVAGCFAETRRGCSSWQDSYESGGFLVEGDVWTPRDDLPPSVDIERVSVVSDASIGLRTFELRLRAPFDAFETPTWREYTVALRSDWRAGSAEYDLFPGATELLSWSTVDGSEWSCLHLVWAGGWVPSPADVCGADGVIVTFETPLDPVASPSAFQVAAITAGPVEGMFLKPITGAGVDPDGGWISIPGDGGLSVFLP